MRKWKCKECGFVYDEALGLPEDSVPPGTPWSDVPEDWICPDCGTPKSGFDMAPVDEVEVRTAVA